MKQIRIQRRPSKQRRQDTIDCTDLRGADVDTAAAADLLDRIDDILRDNA